MSVVKTENTELRTKTPFAVSTKTRKIKNPSTKLKDQDLELTEVKVAMVEALAIEDRKISSKQKIKRGFRSKGKGIKRETSGAN